MHTHFAHDIPVLCRRQLTIRAIGHKLTLLQLLHALSDHLVDPLLPRLVARLPDGVMSRILLDPLEQERVVQPLLRGVDVFDRPEADFGVDMLGKVGVETAL